MTPNEQLIQSAVNSALNNIAEFHVHAADFLDFVPDRQAVEFTEYSKAQHQEIFSVATRVFGDDPQANVFNGVWSIAYNNFRILSSIGATWEDVAPIQSALENTYRQLAQRLYNRAAVLEGP